MENEDTLYILLLYIASIDTFLSFMDYQRLYEEMELNHL